LKCNLVSTDRRGGVLVRLLVSSVVDRRFYPRLGHTKDHEMCMDYFSPNHAASRRNSKYWLVRNQDYMAEWSDMSKHRLLFQRASSIKI